MDARTIGRTLKWARRRAGMTQQELAKAADVPQPSIVRIERGTVIPRTATLLGLLEATGHRITVEPAQAPPDLEAIFGRLRLTVPRRTRDAIGRAAKEPRPIPVHILRRLRGNGVPFVLVGELAEVAHGSPQRIGPTVEVCVEDSDTARQRLALARDDLGEHAAHLRVLTETAAGDGFEALIRNAVNMPVDAGIMVRVAAIEDLVRIRRAGTTPQDRQAEATLRAVSADPLTSLDRRA